MQGFDLNIVLQRETASMVCQPIMRGYEVLGLVTVQAFKPTRR